jgi:hypothetical protein
MRRVVVLVALAALAALLAAYLLFADRGSEVSEGAHDRARLLTTFDRATVRRISIARAGAAPFSLERQPPGREPAWRESPGDKPVDGAAVDDLLNALDVAETTRTADLGLAEAGLTPPKVSIEIDQPGGAVTLALGRSDAGGQGVFTRVGDGATVRVAPRRLLEVADRPPWEFRDRRVVPLPADAVTAIGWRAGEGAPERRLRLVDGRWQNEAEHPVANERAAESVRRLLALRALRYESPRAAVTGPAQIFVEGVRGTTVVLATAGGSCEGSAGTFVERDGPTGDGLCVDPEALRQLWSALAAAGARDLRLLSAPPDSVKRIELTGQGARLVLTRAPSATGWRLEAPRVAYAVDSRAVDDWLVALGRVELRPAAAKPDPRRRHLAAEGRYREEADVSPGDPGYALVEPDPLRFRDRAALDFAHFDARKLERSGAGRAVRLSSRDGEDWRAVSPSGAAVDRTNAARVVGALGNLRVEGFLAKPPAGKPELSLEVEVEAPGDAAPARHRVELYKTKEAPGCTGRLDRDVSFTLAAAVCDELRLPLVK